MEIRLEERSRVTTLGGRGRTAERLVNLQLSQVKERSLSQVAGIATENIRKKKEKEKKEGERKMIIEEIQSEKYAL